MTYDAPEVLVDLMTRDYDNKIHIIIIILVTHMKYLNDSFDDWILWQYNYNMTTIWLMSYD